MHGAYYSEVGIASATDFPALRACSTGLYTVRDYRSIPMAGPSPEQVASRLASVRCAICKTSDFGVDSRSAKPDGEWKGICKKCFYSFPVHTDMEFYQRTQPDIPYLLKTIPCQKCQKPGVSLDFRIVLSVREAYYFVTCKACAHQFPQQSHLEAFE